MPEITQHTPGPWKHNGMGYIHAKNCYGEDDIVASIESENSDSVYTRHADEALANARLIEDAPDLLECLEELLAIIPKEVAMQNRKAIKHAKEVCAHARGK